MSPWHTNALYDKILSMAHGDNTTLVQPIVVLKTDATHQGTITAAALASVPLSFSFYSFEEHQRYKRWLTQRWAKTVRRADLGQWEKLKEWALSSGAHYLEAAQPGGRALALAPTKYVDFPKVLKKLQVSGTNFPLGNDIVSDSGPVLHVLNTLTTGKASAQAAHGLWKWHMDQVDSSPMKWSPPPTEISLKLTSAQELENLALLPQSSVIHDAGFTEIEPDTLTVVARSS